jgi:hypothetical protein
MERGRFLYIPDIGSSTSSGKIPDWRRRIILDEISGLRVGIKGEKFVGPHDNHSVGPRVIGIYTIIAAVK